MSTLKVQGKQSNTSLKNIAYKQISQMIIDDEITPGQPLVEATLAALFSIGRTPVREALLQLSQEGLVELIPNRGAFMARIGLMDIRELFEIREALEGIAVRRAAKTITQKILNELQEGFTKASTITDESLRHNEMEIVGNKLHEVILNTCNNNRLRQIISSNKILLQRERKQASLLPGRIEAAYNDHFKILERLIARDSDGAEEAVRRHISSTAKSLFGGF